MPLIPWDEYESQQETPEVVDPEVPTQELASGLIPWEDYESEQAQPEQPPAPRQFQHTPPADPQIFPVGQDHVAREVLGLKPKPYQRSEILPESHFGVLGDIGSGLASGVLDTGEMALRAYRTVQDMVPGEIDGLREWTTGGIDQIKQWEEEYPEIFQMSEDTANSAFRKAVFGGFRGFIPSATFGALGAVVGGGAVGFALGAGGTFGLAEYDQFMEDAEGQGISREDAFPYAVTSGIVEAGGEALADFIGYKLLGLGGAGLNPFKSTVKNMMKVGLAKTAKQVLKQIPVEVGTEMFQGGSQTFLRNLSGMDAGDPTRAAIESIGPAMVMTMLFGVAGAGKQSIQMRSARKALENGEADPTTRQNAADFVTAHLGKVDKEMAALWRFNTKQYIEAGYGIPIDRQTSEYLSWGEFSKYSPKFAEGLSEGKDIKLLPEGQGFVLIGESYDPDEKADHDQYSPEMAERLIEAKDTKLLPDGQGFTIAGDTTVYSPQLAKKLAAEKKKNLLEAPDRRAEAPAAPEIVPIPPVEAAARGVEAAIETGTPQDIAQAQQRLERRQEPAVPDRTLSLVRSALKATPGATIGEVYRSVKTSNPEANRQEVAKLFRQERQSEEDMAVLLSKKSLQAEVKRLGQEDFNHQYNPVNIAGNISQGFQAQGLTKEEADAKTQNLMKTYTPVYEEVNRVALEQRAKEQKEKEDKAKTVKKAAEGPKKLKAKPKPKKAELKAKEAKKPTLDKHRTEEQIESAKREVIESLGKDEEKPTKKKASAAQSVAAMDKPKPVPTTGVFYRTKKEATQAKQANERVSDKQYDVVERAKDEWILAERKRAKKKATVTKLKPARKKTKAVLTAKETKAEIKRADEKKEEIKPSKIRAGVEVETPDGRGKVIDSPQKDQWTVAMSSGWAKGDNLVFATSELDTGEKKPKSQAKFGGGVVARLPLTYKLVDDITDRDGDRSIYYKLFRGGVYAGEISLEIDSGSDEVYIDWFAHKERDFGKISLSEVRKLQRQFKKENPSIDRFVGFRIRRELTGGRSLVDVKAKVGDKLVNKTYEEGVKSAGPNDNILVTRGDKQGDVLLIQLKSRQEAVTNEDKTYDKVYDNREGYERPADFWEIPMWIGEAANTFEDSDVFVIRNVDNAIAELNKAGYPTIMFSVLDANKADIKKIASKYKGKVVVGGYVDPKYFAGLNNVTFYNTIKEAAQALGVPYKPGVSYVHFKDTETVPRLCLSKGCKHKCAFCVVPKTILTSTKDHIATQLKAFKDLAFKLIYIDDKTFGQANNYTDLVEINKQIKKFNPEFEGFIIQTTAPSLLKMSDQFIQDSGIQYIELGVESYNDDILSKVRKPHRTKQLDKAVIKIRKNGKAFIPNVLVGLTGKGWSETRDSYENTIQFLNKNLDITSHINIYNLALYEGTELHEQLKDKADTEMDENVVTRAYHKEKDIHEEFYKRALEISADALDRNPLQPIGLVRYMNNAHVKIMNPAVMKHRTGIQGEELNRLKDDAEAPNRLHYYLEGGKEEAHIASLPFKYRAEAPAGRFYDTARDPLDLRSRAVREGLTVPDANLAEKMMKDAGYIGYYSKDRGPAIAVVFDKLKVERADGKKVRSSESIAKEAKARQDNKFVRIVREAFPTATEIRPVQGFIGGYELEQDDAFHVLLPNGGRIQVKFNAMPAEISSADFQKDYDGLRDISNEVPLGLWVPDANVTMNGNGVIWIAGLGELQVDVDHETFHAAKAIALTPQEDAQLKKDYPKGEEQEAQAYEEWRKTNRSHKIFDKIRSFFRRIAEAFSLGKGKSYKIFNQISEGKAWTRPFRGTITAETAGKLHASIYGLMSELPKYKKVKGQAVAEDIDNDHKHWMHLGAVLYIEGLTGREWTAEMTAHLKEHYLLDKLPRGTVRSIRKSAQWILKQRSLETLAGKLPAMEALMEMEQRGAAEGGMVWYDARDGLSVMTEGADGEVVARSARAELEEYFGPDAEFMAGLIAHLSSGLAVPANTMKAIEVYIAHKTGQTFKGTHQVSEKQIKQFLNTRLTSGPKRLPFFQAIMGDANAVVIDRWMARVLDFRTWNSKKEEWQTSTGASEAQRKLLVAWVQRGAKRMGITPRAYQALIWAGKKAIDEEAAGRPTGSLDALAKVIEDKVKVAGILASEIPEGREGDYFILPGVDKWAINVSKFMPLKDHMLLHTRPLRKPKDLTIPKVSGKTLTAKEETELDAQQMKMFAKMGPRQSESTIVEDSLDDIFGSAEKGLLQKMKDGLGRLRAWRTLILDEFHPILKHLGDRTYKLHRMLNGVHASIEAFMRHGKLKLDADGHIVADGRNRGFAVWAKKNGADAVNVLRWAAAKRAEHLEQTNPEFLQNEEFLTEAKRERIYKEIGEKPAKYEGTWDELFNEFDEFHQSVLDIAEKAGLIDSVVREDWRDLIYVPFYRVFENSESREEFLANPKKAKDIAARMKPIKGSKRKIGEPIENVIANWGYMIQESMRNQARAEAYVNAKMMNEISDLMRDIDYQEIKNTSINDKGVITYETKRGDDFVLSFLDKGKRKYFSVHDADLYYALTTMNAKHFGKLFNAFFGGPKRLLTYTATFGPAFRVANAVRDTLHTWMITPGASFKPFLDTFKGFVASMREDEHYVAALAAGGLHGGSYVHAEDPTSMSKFTRRLLGKDRDSILLDTGAKVLEFWDRIGAASENAARVQLHKNLVEKGESGFEAAYQARDLLDFALKGQANIVLALIRTIPFLGARTQGNYRLARSFHKGNRLSMSIKGGILAAASLALWSAFKDDDRYKELEDWDKWTYYHFWIGDQHFRMPKPFEVGAIFSSMFESTANTMTDSEEIEFLGRFFLHTFTETFAVGVPQTVKPLAELWANKSFFTGRPIEGRAMQLLEPGERAEPWTSETLQLLGKGLNISPKKMEALMRGYLSTVSAFILGGTDQVARWVGDFPERPSYTASDYPLVGRFWRQGPARNTKYATRLYEAMVESDRLVQTVKHYMIEDNMEAAEKLADSNLGLFSANKMLNRIRKKMTTLRGAMKDVERSRTLSREEKREQINELTVLRNGLVKEVYNILKEELK